MIPGEVCSWSRNEEDEFGKKLQGFEDTVSQLKRDGVLIQDREKSCLGLFEVEVRDTVNAASVRYRIATGPNQSQKTLTLRSEALVRTDSQPRLLTVDREGFALNASVSSQPFNGIAW